MIATIHVSLPEVRPSSYPIWIGSKLLENIPLWMPKCKSTVVIITDNWVKKHYASLLERSLNKEGYKTLLLSFPAGEQSKNKYTKNQLEEKMLRQGCDRDTLILALGGGVVGDLAGFIAATYMRGIAYIQMPTTLLAMVDSSVGGKTGINTTQGKNLIGAFWQPRAVISDIDCLRTLPKKQWINGLIEALKIFLISDADGLIALEQNLDLVLNNDEQTIINLICRAIQIKIDIVKHDERECNQRVVLNLGHTIGHALEQITNYQLLHGYAVALGLLIEAKIAQLMGLLEAKHYQFIKTLLIRLNISVNDLKGFDVNEIIKRTQLDKKKQAGSVRYVLLNDLGNVHEINNQFAHPVPDKVIKKAFLEIIKDLK
jgi:3-dehydroquinate synthase